MTFDVAKMAIDKILIRDSSVSNFIDSYNTQGIIIEFIGGEPFLEIDLIDQITSYFISSMIQLNHPWATKFRISICSNGVLYFSPKVQDYINKYSNFLSLTITIDGNKQLHDACRVFPDGSGSYDSAIKAAIHYKKNHNGKIGSKMTIAPDNVQFIYDAVINLLNLNYKVIYLNCVYEKGWSTENATTLYYQLKKIADYIINNDLEEQIYLSILDRARGTGLHKENNWCGSSNSMLALDYKGRFFPCLRFLEDSLEDKAYIIGDIFNGIGKKEIEKQRIEELYSINYCSQSPQECIECKISDGCAWCTAYNYAETGSVNKRVTYICEMHYASVLASLYYYNSIYKKHNINKRHIFQVNEEKALNIIPQSELEMIKELSQNEYW